MARKSKYDFPIPVQLARAEYWERFMRGEIVAIDNKEEVLAIISESEDIDDARAKLEARFNLDEDGSKAIVDMRLSRLTKQRVSEARQANEDAIENVRYYKEKLSKNDNNN